MAFGSVTLRPGVNVEKTPTLLEASYAQTQLIRFRDGLAQKLGGWTQFYNLALGGVPRDMHAWADLNAVNHLAIGTTLALDVITNGLLENITPQELLSDFAPNFSTVINTPTVTVIDPNISNVTIYDAVLYNTPISVGGIILSGIYQIVSIAGTHSYRITALTNATATVNNAGTVPSFTTTAASAVVSVTLTAHGITALPATVVFPIPTTGNGVTILGAYSVNTISSANAFTITVDSTASASGSFSMNAGNAELLYYISLGPPPTGVGYGIGGYGLGGYGTGVVNPNQGGVNITATDWTSDNWGQLLVACPEDGGIYYWDPDGGFFTATLVTDGPTFNRGIFVSTSQQILIAFGSTVDERTNGGIGIHQDPMLVAWSDVSNFFEWRALTGTQAGNFRIPIGSSCVGGMAVANQNLIWTDLDLWAMNYIGYPDTYGFNKIGAGAGLVSSHGAMQMRGAVYWMGKANFYSYSGSGVQVLQCSVWDFVFQNLNTDFMHNVRAEPNTPFNEAGWAFPSLASVSGENDSYVKQNISEPGQPWDYGTLNRSAWIDLTVLGPPIGAVSGGVIYQHETSNDAAGQPLVSSFTTGYFMLGEGEDFVVVDQIIPDFKWGFFGSPQTAQVQLTFNVINYPGDTPIQYGPFTVTQATQFIFTRFRGRQASVTVSSADLGSFYRLGRIRWRVATSGRR
jgi:hypothetical protein